MNRFTENKSVNAVSSVASMLLFFLFAVCMLVIVAVAAETYTQISLNRNLDFEISSSLRYFTNKIRSSDEVEILENGSGIAVNCSDILSVIYFRDGGIYEKNISETDTPELSGGEKIFSVDSISVSQHGDLYRIEIESGDRQSFEIVRKG